MGAALPSSARANNTVLQSLTSKSMEYFSSHHLHRERSFLVLACWSGSESPLTPQPSIGSNRPLSVLGRNGDLSRRIGT